MSRPSRKPLDQDLYADVVAEAKSRFDVWPSAYASGWVVKTYKARGGRYAGATKGQRTGLTKWFGESWVDLSRPIHDEDGELVGYEPCGRKKSDDPAAYPKCRPLKEAMRMSPSEVKDAIKRKRAAEAKAGRGGRGGRGARAPVRVATYRANPANTVFDWELPGTRGIREVTVDDVTILYGYNGESAHIASVRTKIKAQGQGKARRVLELFCAEADALGIPIKLEASPLTNKVNRARLVAFYESLGFEKTGRTINPAGDPELVRLPVRANPDAPAAASEQDMLHAIEHADVYGDQGWTLDDFIITPLGDVPMDRIRGFDDFSSWVDVDPEDFEGLSVEERLEELAGFRGPKWAERASKWLVEGVPPIVVIEAPDEEGTQEQIGDGRGRINFALAMGLESLPVVLMRWKHGERSNPQGFAAIKAIMQAPEGSLLVSEDGGVAWRKVGPGRHGGGDWARLKPSTTSPDGWQRTVDAYGQPMPPDDFEQIKRFVMREGVLVVLPA